MEEHGITGSVLNWIADFLHNRQQRVKIGDAQSSLADVTSGIPQGSVLGPVLFVLYINDLPDCVKNPVRLFADDTKIFTRSDKDDGTTTLQRDLDRLQDWSSEWLLLFHPEKCHTMKLGRNKSEQIYHMKGDKGITELAVSNIEKDLEVIVDSDLTFKEHVNHVTSKANRILGIIRRSFDYLTAEMFIRLYKALVRPILEYGHSVWQPHHKTLCAELEDVQRRATRWNGSKIFPRPSQSAARFVSG